MLLELDIPIVIGKAMLKQQQMPRRSLTAQ